MWINQYTYIGNYKRTAWYGDNVKNEKESKMKLQQKYIKQKCDETYNASTATNS